MWLQSCDACGLHFISTAILIIVTQIHVKMISHKILDQILKDSLRPYHDKDMLSEKSMGQCQLVLYSFILEHSSRVIGYVLKILWHWQYLTPYCDYSLDELESPLDTPEEDDCKFHFCNILNISDPEWLSEFSIKIVEVELNLRLKEGLSSVLKSSFQTGKRLATELNHNRLHVDHGCRLHRLHSSCDCSCMLSGNSQDQPFKAIDI